MIEGHSSLTSPVDVSLGNGVSNMYNSINSTISKSVSSVSYFDMDQRNFSFVRICLWNHS